MDEQRYAATLARLEYQSGHAIVWRDAICNYFSRLSGITDTKGRVGHHPGRIEAESMQLSGYIPAAVTPWENASGGKAIECASLQPKSCSAKFNFEGTSGVYEIDVQYFDQNNGESKYRVFVRGDLVDGWAANDQLPTTRIGGDSSTRHRIPKVSLQHGDEIRIEGTPEGDEHAALDYVEITPKIQ
jgi:alpha-glucuronidase